jgi:putative transcriptional regulator
MTIAHHPTEETLAAFANGSLDEARGLVVASHVALCRDCRAIVRGFEEAAGVFLEHAEPAVLESDALEKTLARLDAAAPATVVPAAYDDHARDLPAPLQRYAAGPWRWIGRGVEWRSIDVTSDDGTRVFMLRARPGIKLPRHKHAGSEWTCVFQGAFRHQLGRYGAGDFDEADETVEHDPVVEEGETCICLVALQGGIVLQGWLGRLLQPLIRI